jgi:hypothetical protein
MKRSELGAYNRLLSELRMQDAEYYWNCLRMSAEDFDYFATKVKSKIEKQDTTMRSANLIECSRMSFLPS